MIYDSLYLLEQRDSRAPEWKLNEDRDVYSTRENAEAGREEWLGLNAELIDQEGCEYDGHLDGYEVRVVEYRRVG